ncbi:STM3941 family protein [Sphingobacterium spiritivorum]|uniref:STM3941 family protein n=1 Tax=Sphingobacterium spiritivorum TaxID=258 RepID=UPI003DA5917C
MNSKVVIALSKRKGTISFVFSFLFFIVGGWAILYPEQLVSHLFRNPDFIRIIGFSAIVFFGGACFFIGRKLFDNKPGLIIDENGITDNTNATSVGLIEWTDITGIEIAQVMSNKFLIIHISTPEKYLSRAKNMFAKKSMQMNNKTYGSPISIISQSLKIDFKELENLIRSEWKVRSLKDIKEK